MQRYLLLAIFIVFLIPTVCLSGESRLTPVSLPGVNIIDVDTVKKWLDDGEEMIMFDARKANDFDAGHIPSGESYPVPGDLDISDSAIDKSVVALEQYSELKELEKDMKIITYCNGAT